MLITHAQRSQLIPRKLTCGSARLLPYPTRFCMQVVDLRFRGAQAHDLLERCTQSLEPKLNHYAGPSTGFCALWKTGAVHSACDCTLAGHQQHMSEMFSKGMDESCACLRRVGFRGRHKFLCR